MNNYWLAGGSDFSTTTLAESANGFTWSPVPNPNSGGWIAGLAWNQATPMRTEGGAGAWVAVGGGDIVMTSDDGRLWTAVTISGQAGARGTCVIWDGSQWIVGLQYGAQSILTSPDGTTWTARATPFDSGTGTYGVLALAFNGSKYVAAGRTATFTHALATSTDGHTWTVVANPFDTAGGAIGESVVWTGTQWVVGGQATGSHTIMTSPDATTWTLRAAPIDGEIEGLGWNGSLLVGTGFSLSNNTTIMTSPDGIIWTARNTPLDSGTGEASCVIWAGSQWVAGGDGTGGSTIITSPDGVTWSARPNPFDNNSVFCLAYGPAVPPVVTPPTLLNTISGYAKAIPPPASSRMLMAYGFAGGSVVLERYDPLSGFWSAVPTPWDNPGRTNFIQTGLFVAQLGLFFLGGGDFWLGTDSVTDVPVLMSSSNGITWTNVPNPLAGSGNSYINILAWNGTILLAGGEGPTSSSPSIMTTSDGVTWTGRSSPFDGNGYVYDAAWNGSQWLAVGYDGTFVGAAASSPDGVTWTSVPIPWNTQNDTPRTVCWHPPTSRWIIGGTHGGSPTQVITSSGPPWTWTAHTTPITNAAQIRYLNGTLFATGTFTGGAIGFDIATSTDTATWTVELVGTSQANSVFWDGDQYWQGGSNNMYVSPDGIGWIQSPGLLDGGQVYGFLVGPPGGAAPLPPPLPSNYVGVPGVIPVVDRTVTAPPSYNGALFVAGNSDNGPGTLVLAKFTNGSWAPVTTPWDAMGAWIYTGLWVGPPISKFFVGGWQSGNGHATTFPVLMASADGNTWANVATPWDNSANGFATVGALAWNGQILLAGGNGKTSTDHGIMSSTDGIAWTGRSSVFTGGGYVNDLAWNGQYWLAVGVNGSNAGVAATSPDGITWTTSPMPWNGATGPNSVAWHSPSSRWIVVGNVSGQALISPDAQTWTAEGLPLGFGNQVRSFNSKVLAVGTPSTALMSIAVSPDGVSWSSDAVPGVASVQASYWDGGTYWALPADTGSNLRASPDAVTWTPMAANPIHSRPMALFSRGSVQSPVYPASLIAFVGADAEAMAAPSSTLTLAAPGSIVAGNFLVAVVEAENQLVTAPTGWQFVDNSFGMFVFTKVAGLSEPATYNFTLAASIQYSAGVILQYSGTTALDGPVHFTTTSSAQSSSQVNPLTPSQVGGILIAVFYAEGSSFSTPTGMTLRKTATGPTASIAVFDMILTTTSPTPTLATTQTPASFGVAVDLLLHP